MRSKLTRPDLQCIINEICKIFIEYNIVPWIEHIPGKKNIIPDALSRDKPIATHLIQKCTIKINANNAIQRAANLCKDIVINNKYLDLSDS